MTARSRYSSAAQLERTLLAWNRSALAIGTNGALIAREGFEQGIAPLTGAGLTIVCISVTIWALASGHYLKVLQQSASYLLARSEAVVVGFALMVAAISIVDLVTAIRF